MLLSKIGLLKLDSHSWRQSRRFCWIQKGGKIITGENCPLYVKKSSLKNSLSSPGPIVFQFLTWWLNPLTVHSPTRNLNFTQITLCELLRVISFHDWYYKLWKFASQYYGKTTRMTQIFFYEIKQLRITNSKTISFCHDNNNLLQHYWNKI